MRKSAILLAALVTATVANAQSDRFRNYKPVQAYEVRPGVLVIPTYVEGQVCSLEVQKRAYSKGVADLRPGLTRKQITDVLDELVPADERGPKDTSLGKDYLSAYTGNSITSFAEYKNLSIYIYGQTSIGDVIALVKWKRSGCS